MISWISLDYTDWGAAAQVRGAARAAGRSISMHVLTTAPGVPFPTGARRSSCGRPK